MINKRPRSVVITGTGAYIPEQELTNRDLEHMVDTTDEWILQRTGIHKRHIVSNGEASSDLAHKAASQAMEAAGITSDDLDMIIVGTITPDTVLPSTACLLQHKLGVSRIPCFDISAACSGFLYSLAIGSQFIATGVYQRVLVVGVDCMSVLTDYKDRASCILFGDGAGAAILEGSDDENRGILRTYLGAQGSGGDLMVVPGGGSRMPFCQRTLDERQQYLKIKGRAVYKFAVSKMTELLKQAIQDFCKDPDNPVEIGLVVPHQVNQRIIDGALQRVNIPSEKIFVNLEKYGNTSGASVPIALHEAFQEGYVKKDELVILIAFGAGLTWASLAVRW